MILTSSKEERDLIKGYGLGANSYIQKPVDFQQFRDTVKSVGLYWLLINQPPGGTERGTVRSALLAKPVAGYTLKPAAFAHWAAPQARGEGVAMDWADRRPIGCRLGGSAH